MKAAPILVLGLALCSCSSSRNRSDDLRVAEFLAEPVPEFDLTYSISSGSKRIELRLAAPRKEVCLPVDQWPSLRGTIEEGDRAKLKLAGKTVFATGDRFGHCPGGCGYLKVAPTQPLHGFIDLGQFPSLEDSELKVATFELTLRPFECKDAMKIVGTPFN